MPEAIEQVHITKIKFPFPPYPSLYEKKNISPSFKVESEVTATLPNLHVSRPGITATDRPLAAHPAKALHLSRPGLTEWQVIPGLAKSIRHQL